MILSIEDCSETVDEVVLVSGYVLFFVSSFAERSGAKHWCGETGEKRDGVVCDKARLEGESVLAVKKSLETEIKKKAV